MYDFSRWISIISSDICSISLKSCYNYGMDLFDHAMQDDLQHTAPLAARLRPRTLDEFVGQEHIIGEGRLLRRAIIADRLFSSIIFTGRPGTGKTTLARLIAQHTQAHFESISAVLAGVADLRRVIAEATDRRRLYRRRTILFIDEVHRWNRAQQDALLPHVENGMIMLIGATTENPYFDVIPALVSRSRIFQLEPLKIEQLGIIFTRALEDKEFGYGNRQIEFAGDARDHLLHQAGGDARNLLNAIELAVETTPVDSDGIIRITLDVAQESIQKRALLYDRMGDEHYDTISAFIKSVRGSDPDAALYWLAKMILAGEDPRFILRRLIVLSGEDIGLADPQGIQVAALAEVFEKFPQMRYAIEIKKSEIPVEQPLCDLIRQYKMEEKVLVASFHDEVMQNFRATCPEVATSASRGEVTRFVILGKIFLSRLVAPGYESIQPPFDPEESYNIPIMTRRFIRESHRKNIKVEPWTVDDPELMEQYIEWGVDGIITDRPDLIVEILGK